MHPPADRALPLWVALLVALAAGPILDAGFPDRGWWPATFLGIGLVLWALRGRRAGGGFLVGLVAGLSFYLVHIQWASLFLGLLPMVALSALEALFFGVGGMAITLAYRWAPRVWRSTYARLLFLPLIVAGLWTAREAIASVWPYGGFAWGRVALSQSESPVAALFGWLGVSGVSFVMVFLVAVAVEAIRLHSAERIVRATVAVGLAAVILAIPAFPTSTEGTMRVAAVQGDGRAGYFDTREPGDLLKAQVDATTPLIEAGVKPDVVVWPEGATDDSPLESAYTARVFDYISESLDAPLVAWAVTTRPAGDTERYYNTSMLWRDGEGELDFYDKKHPVPFGEYVPDRAFWRPFAPDLIDLVGREYTPGTTDGIFDIDGVVAAVNICFDIVDDQILTDSVDQGAQIVFAQSNTADFGHTDESVQQLAIARVRAIELGRSVVNISTVGTSAIIAPDGSTIDRLPTFEAGSMVEDVPLSTATTPAVLLGRQVEWLVSGIGVLGLLLAGLLARDGRSQRGSRRG
ncbi:MAG: lnt [Microbacteriaceae bacterium]|nr:lnt [Microbacteriaceae bacterium]